MSFARYAKYNNKGSNNTWLEISFEKYVKVSKTKAAYSFLSFIAEVGGYVGLFLGISINQISVIFKHFIAYILRK